MTRRLLQAGTLLLLAVFASCKQDADGTAPRTLHMSKAAGDGQTATAGTSVVEPPAVRIEDDAGAAVAGQSVTFAVAGGGGSVTGATATTDASGTAAVGSWVLGAAGAQSLTATAAGESVTGSPATFTATSVAGPAAQLDKAEGDAQSATVGAAVAVAPRVRVTDALGDPVAGVGVTFAASSGGGSVTGATQTTDASGEAAVGGWVLGTAAGENVLTATAAGDGIAGNPATFSATATADVAANLAALEGDGQSAAPGAAVAVAPAVKATDRFGNGVVDVPVGFAVTAGGGSVAGAAPTTGADGVARVGSWTLGPSAGTNTLTATAQGSGIAGNPVVFTATAQALLNAAQYVGSWAGTWRNDTFASTGTTSLTIAVDEAAQTATLTSSSTGNVLGQGGAPQQSTMSAYDQTGFSLSATLQVYGDVTLTVDGGGKLEAHGVNVPSAGIDHWDATGTITATHIAIDFTVFFNGGGTATGSVSLDKS